MILRQSRIPMLERDHVPPEIQAIYDALEKQRGVVPSMFKTLAHTPELAVGIAAFLKPLLGDGALPAWYKELVATRVAVTDDAAGARRHPGFRGRGKNYKLQTRRDEAC